VPRDPGALAAPAIDRLDGDRVGRQPDRMRAAAPEIEALSPISPRTAGFLRF
jgi:hypothetical protein